MPTQSGVVPQVLCSSCGLGLPAHIEYVSGMGLVSWGSPDRECQGWREPGPRAILVDCPVLLLPINTGGSSTEAEWEHATMSAETSSCVACGGAHTWSRADAYLSDVPLDHE